MLESAKNTQSQGKKGTNINKKLSTRGNVRFTENESIDVTADR